MKSKNQRNQERLKVAESKASKYTECFNENRRQYRVLQEKVRELETAKNEIVKLKEVADRASKISQSNSDLVVRKCALEVQNNQKDKIISE